MAVKLKEIAWLAGIIEGEGHIGYTNSPFIRIKMADKDVIEKIASLLKRPIHEDNKNYGWKDCYYIAIHGTAAIEWLYTIYSFLGVRRRDKALEVINFWKGQQSNFKRDTFRCGHPKVFSNIRHKGRYKVCRTCILERG